MKTLLLIPLAALLAASPALSKAKPAELKWTDGPPSLPSGAQMAVVSGDPGKEGKFTIQLKMPADYAVPPHSHPTDEVVKVVSGEVHYAMSDKMDMAKAKTLKTRRLRRHEGEDEPLGSRVCSGHGPGDAPWVRSQITYVDPKDDPRTK